MVPLSFLMCLNSMEYHVTVYRPWVSFLVLMENKGEPSGNGLSFKILHSWSRLQIYKGYVVTWVMELIYTIKHNRQPLAKVALAQGVSRWTMLPELNSRREQWLERVLSYQFCRSVLLCLSCYLHKHTTEDCHMTLCTNDETPQWLFTLFLIPYLFGGLAMLLWHH